MPAKAGKGTSNSNNVADTTAKKRKISQDSDKKGAGVSFEVYHSEAGTFQGIGEFRKAINSYTRALDIRSSDKNCLIARAQCYQNLGEADKALSDANETLKEDPKYIKGLLMKAEAYYQMMYFEYALMYYHRGHKLRPEVQAFRLGIQKSQEAIENCIGERAGVHLENKGDLSFFYEEQLAQQQKKKPNATYTKPTVKTEVKIERKHRTACTDPKTVKELLGELYTDKEYLEKLLQETESANNQSETNKAIRTLAIQGLDYLDTRTEFWQQQKPMYSRRRDRQMREDARLQAAAEVDKSKDPTQWILRKLEEIDDAQANGQYEASLKQSKRLLKDLNKWTDSDVCSRQEFLANAHSCLGNALLETGDYDKALNHHTKDYDLAVAQQMPDAKSRALDNLGRVHARMGHFDKAIQVWEEKLPSTKSALENTWLYHEIGRCHLEMDHPDEAKEFGDKSLEAAEEADDELWQLNASVLIAQANVKLKELEAAVNSFNRALELAKLQTDRAAENAIRRAIDDINNTIAKQNQHESRHGSAATSQPPHSARSDGSKSAASNDDGSDEENAVAEAANDAADDADKTSDTDTAAAADDADTAVKDNATVDDVNKDRKSDDEAEEDKRDVTEDNSSRKSVRVEPTPPKNKKKTDQSAAKDTDSSQHSKSTTSKSKDNDSKTDQKKTDKMADKAKEKTTTKGKEQASKEKGKEKGKTAEVGPKDQQGKAVGKTTTDKGKTGKGEEEAKTAGKTETSGTKEKTEKSDKKRQKIF